MFGLKKTNKTISDLDSFLDYLEGNKKDFDDNLESITKLRDTSTDLRRTIENELYSYSLVTDQRVEIMQLLEQLDMIVNLLHKNLWQYEIEIPFFPSELNVDFLKLVEITGLAVEGTIQATRDYFKAPRFVNEKTHRIYFFEKERLLLFFGFPIFLFGG